MKQSVRVATGTLFVVSGASGSGKSSLVGQLAATQADLVVSVSHTTRPRRPAEKDGVHYNFIDAESFQARARDGLFLEYAQVFHHYYGTSREWVTQRLRSGVDVVLEIDWQGARQVRERTTESIGIFILPPSRQALETRLRHRAQDSPEVVQQRLREASNDMSHFKEFDYVIINDDFATALNALRMIVQVSRLRCCVQAQRNHELLSRLLASPSSFE
nr:guanylate kinase [Gammaproteobacteria bacterium]